MHKAFYDVIRKDLFGGDLKQSQVDGIERIAMKWSEYGDGDERKLAYILATDYHETAKTMQPVREYGGLEYLKSKKYYPFYGRGDIQLTWEANYADWSKRLDMPLVQYPDMALQPAISARILVQGMMLGTFTHKKLADYIHGGACDFKEARRVVNGTDKANLIADHAWKFLAAIQAAPAPPDVEPVLPIPSAATLPPTGVQVRNAGIFAVIAAAVAAVLKWFGWF